MNEEIQGAKEKAETKHIVKLKLQVGDADVDGEVRESSIKIMRGIYCKTLET